MEIEDTTSEDTPSANPADRPDALPKSVAGSTETLQPQVVVDPPGEEEERTSVSEPARLLRIASMTRAMLEEVRQADLDEAGRDRLLQIYSASMNQLKDSLSGDLVAELDEMFGPFEGHEATESELRIVQAQLVGWLEGLFHGIQASIFSQQAAAAAQLEEMRRRIALEGGSEVSGQYL
jgi:hypothetical protein